MILEKKKFKKLAENVNATAIRLFKKSFNLIVRNWIFVLLPNCVSVRRQNSSLFENLQRILEFDITEGP